MDFHKLRCFITVVEEGSISKAAFLLNMTQPPLSITLRKLEEELNVALFDRRGKKLTLTDTGKLLYQRSKELMASSESIKQELVEQAAGTRGTVNVGISTSANMFIIPKVLEKIRQTSPNIVVRVREGNAEYILRELRNLKLDVCIVRQVFEAEDLQTTTLQTESLLVALPPGHHLLNKPSIELRDLQDENFLLPATTLGQGISEQIIEACQSSGFSPKVIYWGTEILPMLLMVKRGLGISFAPQCFRELTSPALPQLVKLSSPPLYTKQNLVISKNHYITAVTQRFLEITKETFDTAMEE